jgi:hypothetical protein
MIVQDAARGGVVFFGGFLVANESTSETGYGLEMDGGALTIRLHIA